MSGKMSYICFRKNHNQYLYSFLILKTPITPDKLRNNINSAATFASSPQSIDCASAATSTDLLQPIITLPNDW